MALTRNFKDTVKARAERDPEFRVALLEEALDAFLNADLDTGKVLLRDYVNATVGFEQLRGAAPQEPEEPDADAQRTGEPPRRQPLRRGRAFEGA